MKTPMLVLLAGMVRTNPVIRGSKLLVSNRYTPIVALQPVTLQSQSEKDVPHFWKCLETNGNNECNATINPIYSMIFAAISYSNAKSG
jgi:hypothetical protein